MSRLFKIRLYLISILLLVGAIPFYFSYLAFNELISYQSDVAQKINLSESLDGYQSALKDLSKINKNKEAQYKEQFEKVHEKQALLNSQNLLWDNIKTSLKKTYLLFFGAFTGVVILLGMLISGLISKLYAKTHQQLQIEMERVNYLKQFENVSDIIKMMNHEIKKPLAPLEIWLNTLIKAAQKNDLNTIDEASQIVREEMQNLSAHLKAFNKFGSLPDPKLTIVEFDQYLTETLSKFSDVYTNIEVEHHCEIQDLYVKLDKGLFSQVLQNLFENAQEANPDLSTLFFKIVTKKHNGAYIQIDVFNQGIAIKDLEQVFKPYFSTKEKSSHSGLGLTISKATMIKHQGDLNVRPCSNGALFEIKLPIYKSENT
ncbi:MAG: HAMP domain-containing histidine kinase [Bdellovibrionaceae bacterium]|nr:HAMP domain-containing histidine kinase [Pseudobdellovibrionaceae bacterium]